MTELPKYESFSLTELYQALDSIRPDLHAEAFAALERELHSREPESKSEIEECYLSLDKDKWPQYAAQLFEQIEALGGFSSDPVEKIVIVPPAALPVIPIFLEGVSLPFKHLGMVVRFGSPLIILLTLHFAMPYFAMPLLFSIKRFADFAGVADFAAANASMIVGLFLGVFFLGFILAVTLAIVACHRIFILGENSIVNHNILRWSFRETRFIGWWIGIVLLTILVALPINFFLLPAILSIVLDTNIDMRDVLSGIDANSNSYLALFVAEITFLVNLPVFYLFSRWALVLPATAADQRPKLAWAKTVSRGNRLRLMVLVGLLPVLMDYAFAFLPDFDSVAYAILVTVVWLYVAVAEIALLSLSYKTLVESEPARKLVPVV